MFGDVAHGSIVFLAGLGLCIAEKFMKDNEDLQPYFKIRYLFLMMGFFATYMGFIYNDFMSLPLEVFGKGCYEAD